MLEEEIVENYNYWNDKDCIEELIKRFEELKSGKVKGILWEDVMAQIVDSSR